MGDEFYHPWGEELSRGRNTEGGDLLSVRELVCAGENPTKPTYSHASPRKPAYPPLFPRKPTQSLWGWGGVSYLCIAIGVRVGLWLVSLRLPLDVPYGAARNGGVGLGDCG